MSGLDLAYAVLNWAKALSLSPPYRVGGLGLAHAVPNGEQALSFNSPKRERGLDGRPVDNVINRTDRKAVKPLVKARPGAGSEGTTTAGLGDFIQLASQLTTN
ncbi:MAG: hypothetical protein JXA42_21705 [Anaerolineales bacterium]|nr:hypothetical protein [Anaerolineales bacterium]